MVDLVTYEFKYFETGNSTPEESFMRAYTEEVYELEHVCTCNKLLRVIIYAKDEKAYLNKVMKINANIRQKYNLKNC